MKKLVIFLFILLLMAGCDTSDFMPTDNNLSTDIPLMSDAQKQEFLDAVNAARADTQDCGTEGVFPPAEPLTWNEELYKAAYAHTLDMAVHGVVTHDGSNTEYDTVAYARNLGRGSYFYERIDYAGYGNYLTIGENVAGGTYYSNAQIVVDAWLDSDGHCANLMNKNFKEIGMAVVKMDTTFTYYWSQEFGAR